MIPKIIHYSWFSGEEMPEAFVQMMDTWKRVLPDYELKLWDADALKEANLTFANEAYSERKWAFAADVIRVYAVYHYGGIWLDGDVAVYKSFDPFLNNRMFIGREPFIECQTDNNFMNVNLLTSHCFGAEAKHPFLKDCLDYYKDRHFITSLNKDLPQGLRFDMRLLPSIQARLATKYGYTGNVLEEKTIKVLEEDIHVYPSYFFDSPKYHDESESYCVHFKYGAWYPSKDRIHSSANSQYKRKKDAFYYLFTWMNKILARKGLQIKVFSV